MQEALDTQITLITKHIARLEDQLLSRYATNSFAHAYVVMQLAAWRQTLEIITAISNGKTVQPS